ncbi:MAG: response regulator transcription factor [Spirochaetales bacterium]|nr:response regulator transcription factor [Spirochaetales bacterium]
MEEQILIIDDDKKLNSLLTDYLAQFKYSVRSVTSPGEGLQLLERSMPDLIVLDIMLPQMNGFEVCKKIRERWEVPIIMLTARGEVSDRIVGLELGADDYLPKPFEPRELAARIQSILRRTQKRASRENQIFGDLRVDTQSRAVYLNNTEVNVTTMEFDALALLASDPGRVFTREQLQEKLKGYDWDAYDRSIDVLISRLRQKLSDDPKNPQYIKTVWGSGYSFIGRRENQ